MATRKDVILAIREIRNDIFARSKSGNAHDKLRNRCERVDDVGLGGQGYGSVEMIDPLFPSERGHSVCIVPKRGLGGWIASLTGKKIIGSVRNRKDDIEVQRELKSLTGAHKWKRRHK